MNRIYSNIVLTRSLEGVFLRMSTIMCWYFVMSMHAMNTLVPTRLLRKFCRVGSIGLLYSRTPLNFANSVQNVKWRIE